MVVSKHPEPRAAYVHVPFCHRRCPYCNFTLVADRLEWIDRYLLAIESELSTLGHPHQVDTIFIGGGTPTLLDENQLRRLTDLLRRWLPMAPDGEWTIEANPNDLTTQKCDLLARQGINRVSIGGQSFDSDKLRILGREHSGDELRSAISTARQFFSNISVDLIFGAPKETLETWIRDLQSTLECDVEHVSTYGLTYEKGAVFWSQRQQGKIQSASEEDELAMYFEATEQLTSHGMIHYEVSNFARPNLTCRHNETYWNAMPWWGFGPGAASFVAGKRNVNHRSTSKYLQRIEADQSPVSESESVDWVQWTRERFVFGMRKIAGVDWEELEKSGHRETLMSMRPTVEKHLEMGWFIQEQSRVRLSWQGLAISDALWPEYF
ncbi:MAG: radical SAM family heme chaperone HemW [Pirellulaceae bacterium]|nr:radical SAM family heme chaperone HemW [Pirellulaceae bacterium]